MTPSAASSATTGVPSALEPVRRCLLDEAHRTADNIVSDAQRAGDELIAAAQRESDEALDRAHRRAEATVAAQAAQARENARRDAHAELLRTHDELRRELADRVRDAAVELRHDPRYPVLLDELERLARDQLGADAEVDRDPDQGGGVVAVSGDRRVDYRMPVLADRAIAAIADEVATLWS